jgi:hypothetical protein
VLLDSELAALYGVETRVLNQAVRRNAERFPKDFRFQLTPAEAGCDGGCEARLERSPIEGVLKIRIIPTATSQGPSGNNRPVARGVKLVAPLRTFDNARILYAGDRLVHCTGAAYTSRASR